jgi:4-amino-4-deoxy-L-arabinose transferase-like glycosyltransferase
MRLLGAPAARWTALLGGALAWRLILFVGAQGSDDLAYSEAAWTLASGHLPFDQGIHGLRIGYVGAIGALYALFGAGTFTLVLVNLVASVGEVALVRLLAREFLDESGAWLAALLVAILPVHVFHATEAHPDVPAAALTTLAALLFVRARKTDAVPFYLLSGVALGAAQLMKESSFLGLGALAALAGPFRLRALLPLAGFAAVEIVEAGFFWAAAGDPLLRIHRVKDMQSAIMGSEFYLSAAPTFRRLVIDVPAMFFWPGNGQFAFFGLLPLLAATGGVQALCRREAALRGPLLWAVGLTALIVFWPISIAPYRPAMVAFPRVFLPIAPPLAILAAGLLRKASPRVAGSAIAAVSVAALGGALLLHWDARRMSVAARIAHPATGDLAVVSDPRTLQFFRLFDGYKPCRPLVLWTDAAPGGPHYRVVNSLWIRNLREWNGTPAPPGFADPGVLPFRTETIPGRVRLGALLGGRIEHVGSEELRIFRMP